MGSDGAGLEFRVDVSTDTGVTDAMLGDFDAWRATAWATQDTLERLTIE
jgi:hypothetical protein